MNPRLLPILQPAVLVLLCAALYLPYLARLPFFDKGEPREAVLVQDIVDRGDWLFPLKWGAEIPSKPPLFHWFGALVSIAWGGVSEATVRFPSVLFATAGVLVLYFFGRRLFHGEAGLYGAVILATSFVFQSEAVAARVDMTLAFFLTATLVTFYLLYRGYLAGALWTVGFYLLLGVSVLAKGPVGLILPAMIIGSFLAFRRKWAFLWRLSLHPAVILTFLIAISWYGIALWRGGEAFFNRQIIHENLARFFVSGEEGAGHQKPFYYYFPYLFVEGLPWTFFLPLVLVEWSKKNTFVDEDRLFLLLWIGMIFFFFSLSSGKRAVYLLPLYPPLSLAIGLWLASAESGRVRGAGFKALGWIFLTVGIIVLLLGAAFFAGKDFFWLLSVVRVMLTPKDQAQLAIVQEGLRRAGWLFPSMLLLCALLWLATARCLFTLRASLTVALLSILSLLSGLLVQGTVTSSIAEARSYRPFMAEVDRRVAGNEELAIDGAGWDYTSALFYRGKGYSILQGDSRAVGERLRQTGGYCIMSEREWQKLVAAEESGLALELRSRGTGPEGRDPIVLVRGIKRGAGR